MGTPIEQDQQKILKYMYNVERQNGVSTSIRMQNIREGTGLTSYQIGTAIELMDAKGLVTVVKGLLEDDTHFISARLTAKGRLNAEKMSLDKKTPRVPKTHSKNPRNVFVVHGRDLEKRDAMFDFLHALDLHPLEWTELVKGTGKGSPYVGEVLDKAFSEAQAVIVLMTPDDEGQLRVGLRGAGEPAHETELTPQARLNAIFEAGIAMGYCPERTIIVEIGQLRPFSDVAGRHTVRMDNSSEKRLDLAQRLENTGCTTNKKGAKWLSAGDFSITSSDDQRHKKTVSPERGLEKLQFTNVWVSDTLGIYLGRQCYQVAVQLKNIGTTNVTINHILLNGQPFNSASLRVPGGIRAYQTGIVSVTLQPGQSLGGQIYLPVGGLWSSGNSVQIDINTTTGGHYPYLVNIP